MLYVILTQSLIELPTSLLTEELTVKTILLVGLIIYVNKDSKNKEDMEKMRDSHKDELREKDRELQECEKEFRRKELEYIEKMMNRKGGNSETTS